MLGNPLTTRPSWTGWELTIQPYLCWRFGFFDNPDRQFGISAIWTRTRTRSYGPEPLLTLIKLLLFLEQIWSSSDGVFNEFKSNITVAISMLGNLTWGTVKSRIVVNRNLVVKYWLLSYQNEKIQTCQTLCAYLFSCIQRYIENTDH